MLQYVMKKKNINWESKDQGPGSGLFYSPVALSDKENKSFLFSRLLL